MGEFGADVEALDTYGMTPLHRMASNNLPIGAEQLLSAGADPSFQGKVGATPAEIANDSRASAVLAVLKKYQSIRGSAPSVACINGVDVLYQGPERGMYHRTSADEVPPGFDAVCRAQGWNTDEMWRKLNRGAHWFRHESDAYLYFNQADKCWWLDAASGEGIWKVQGPAHAVPAHGWKPLADADFLPPMIRCFRNTTGTIVA